MELLFPCVAKHALDIAELHVDMQHQGLTACASTLAKRYPKSHVLRPTANAATKMMRHLDIAIQLEKHFATLGSTKWLSKFEELFKVLDREVSPRQDEVSSGETSTTSCSNSTRQVVFENYDIASECGEQAPEPGSAEVQCENLAAITEQLLNRVSLLEQAFIFWPHDTHYGDESCQVVQATASADAAAGSKDDAGEADAQAKEKADAQAKKKADAQAKEKADAQAKERN